MNIAAAVQKALRALPAAMKASVTFSRIVPGVFDPATDTRTGDVVQSFTVAAPFLPVAEDALAQGDPTVPVKFREITLAAADCLFPPRVEDQCTAVVNGETWYVAGSQEVKPDGITAVAYIVRVKR